MVSIIIPVYQAEKTIERCLLSVRNQTFTDYECIIINDGSTDRSYDICNEYAIKDDRFICINQDQKGVSAARNKGIELSRGKYITFIDSDDELMPDFISDLVNEAISSQSDIVIGGYNYICRGIKSNRILSYPTNIFSEANENLIAQAVNNGLLNYIWGKLYISNLLKKHSFEMNVSWGEDTIFLLGLLTPDVRICFLKNANYNYYVSEKGLSSSYGDNYESTFNKYVNGIKLFLDMNGFTRKSLVYQAFYVKIANEMLSYINTCIKERNTDIKWILASNELCSFICRGVLWGRKSYKTKNSFFVTT